MNGQKSDRTEEALRKRFEAEEQQAIDALARWIGHPAVRGIIGRRRIGAETVVMPIEQLLANQTEVIRFCWHVLGIAGIEPGWELRRGAPWLLTFSQTNVIERVEADFRGVVQLTVNELEGAGVGLVPSWAGDHVVVGGFLLLDIEWDLPARELAAALQPPAIGAIHIDASGTTHRRGSGERANNNIGALRRAYEQHKYGPRPRAPYAGGGTRALPEPTRRRRQALAKVRERWPDVTSSQIFTTFGDHGVQRGGLPRTPGGYLRRLLAREAPGEIVRRPSKSTLHEDLKALRAASRDQKPQHPGRGRLRDPRQRRRLPGGSAAVRRRAGGHGHRSSGVRPGRACHVPRPRDQAVPAAAPRRKLTRRTAPTLAYAAVPGLAGQG